MTARPFGPFEVWAPRAARVTLALGDARHELRPLADGRFAPDDEFVPPSGEVDYGFLLDDDELLLPDPRSRRQPAGVHGPSRTFDAAAHDWRDADWTGRPLAGSVLYELHVGAFTPGGTLDSAIDALDELVDLGVDAVELMPVAAFNGDRGWGYDGVDWFAVHEAYGGPAAYQRFVDACHVRGLAVVQDVVYNHFGPSGNYLGKFGPYLATGRGTDWGDSLNLDGRDADDVRRYILDNARMWFEDFHVDGLRLDAVHALVDSSALPILEELSRETAGLEAHLGRPLWLVAESDRNDPRTILPREAGGVGMSGQWSDDFHHAVHTALTGESQAYYADFATLDALAKVLESGFFHDGSWSSFRGRDHGRPLPRGTSAWRLVGSIQNHDQVGNRARGDRLSEVLCDERLLIGAVLLLTSPFTPMLFMGEEWGASTPFPFFTSHPEPELAEGTREGRLREFAAMGWDRDRIPDPQDEATFRSAVLDRAERAEPGNARVLAAYRELIRLRRALPELTSPWLGEVRAEGDDEASTLAFTRGDVRVAINFSELPREVRLPLAPRADPAADRSGDRIVYATEDGAELGATGDVVTLPAESAVVVAPAR